MQHGLVENHVETHRRVPVEEPLPPQPDLEELLGPLWRDLRDPGRVHRARVVGGLEQSGDDPGLVAPDLYGLGLQAHVGREVVQVVALLPARLLAFAGQVEHPVALGLVGHVVEVAQVPDVPGGRCALSRLHAAQLAHGDHQLLGGLLDGEALAGAELAQQGAEFAAANGRTAHFRHERSVLSQESDAVAHHPGPIIPILGMMQMIHAACTLSWHLPSRLATRTMKSGEQEASSDDPPTMRSSWHGGYRRQIACQDSGARRDDSSRHKRRPGRWRGDTAISLSPLKPHALPLCRSMRAVALPRQPSRRAGGRPGLRCAIPQTRRWAGAATPTQRNTTQALERAGRAGDVINVSNFTSLNKPSGWLAAPAEPTLPAGPGDRAAAGRPYPDDTRTRGLGALAATRIMLSWLAALPGRLGDRLFAMNDNEAYWRDWQITRTHGGLGRRYRDPSFDLPPEYREV